MAELKSNVLGKLRGSIGNVTGRIRNGKNYLAARPGSFTPGNDPASIARRAKFKLAVKFSSAILKNNDLKKIWEAYITNCKPAFQYLMPLNYKLFTDNDISSSNIITPLEGFGGSFSNVSLTTSALNTDLAALNGLADFDLGIETEIKLIAVVYLSKPTDESSEDYSFITLESTGQVLQLTDPTSFSIPLSNYESSRVEAYQNNKVFLAALTSDDTGNSVNYSITVTQ